MNKELVVVLSGGFDSSLCLFQSMNTTDKEKILAVSFDYGQGHKLEIDAAKKITKDWGIDHIILKLDILTEISNSSLTNDKFDMNGSNNGRLNVVLPGRNGLFIRLASMLGYKYGAVKIVTGINFTDSPDFVDCTRTYMDALERVLRIDFGDTEYRIITPISELKKEEIFEEAFKLNVLDYLLENTVSCYRGIPKDGCKNCPSCTVKNLGLKKFYSKNPIRFNKK